MTSSPLFDVEAFRHEPRRVAIAQEVSRATLVLGSTQRADIVAPAAQQRGVDVARRRSGGGAVYLQPGQQLWIDAWVPRGDALWDGDVSRAAEWAGAWWANALEVLGVVGVEVHTGRAEPGELGELVCFAGRGPGEAFVGGRKLMGLSQWRSREGSLFSACTYRHWDPEPIGALVAIDAGLVDDLAGLAVGLGDLDQGLASLSSLQDALLSSFSDWATTTS